MALTQDTPYVTVNPVPVEKLGGIIQTWCVAVAKPTNGEYGGAPGRIVEIPREYKEDETEARNLARRISREEGIELRL